MKKTMKMMLALMAGAMAFTSCQEENILENTNEQPVPSALKPMTFTAFQEGQNGATRAAIDSVDIKWVSGDAISIFDGVKDADNHFDHEFTLTEGVGSTSGIFSGSAADDASVYYAFYPALTSFYEEHVPSQAEAQAAAGSAANELDYWNMALGDEELGGEWAVKSDMDYYGISAENQTIILAYLKEESLVNKSGIQYNASNKFENVEIPTDQSVNSGEFVDPNAMLMIAKSTDKSTLQFKNVCAYVKVTPTFDCYCIAITSKGSESIAGIVTLDYNDGIPSTTVTSNGKNSVCLTGDIEAGHAYYIAVRPESLESGFFIDFITDNKSYYYQRCSDKKLTLTRNHVTDFGEFDTADTWTYSGYTSGLDGTHGWALIAPGLKLATEFLPDYITANNINTYISEHSWGSDWCLPSKADLENKLINCTYNSSNQKATIRGIGALRALPIETTANTLNGGYIWTSDPIEGNSAWCWSFSSGTITGMTYWTNWPTIIYMYKK